MFRNAIAASLPSERNARCVMAPWRTASACGMGMALVRLRQRGVGAASFCWVMQVVPFNECECPRTDGSVINAGIAASGRITPMQFGRRSGVTLPNCLLWLGHPTCLRNRVSQVGVCKPTDRVCFRQVTNHAERFSKVLRRNAPSVVFPGVSSGWGGA